MEERLRPHDAGSSSSAAVSQSGTKKPTTPTSASTPASTVPSLKDKIANLEKQEQEETQKRETERKQLQEEYEKKLQEAVEERKKGL